MLQLIRDRSQGLIVGVIVFLISLTFALFGIEQYVNSGGTVVVAEVEGEEIGLREFQDSLQRIRRQAESILGESFNAGDWNSAQVRERALNELINDRLLARLANDARIRISDVQVAEQIQRIATFQQDNVFSKQLYRQRVSLLGFNELQFEEQMRRNLEKAQIRAGIAASEFVTQQEAERIEQLRKQKRDIGYAIIPASGYAEEVTVTEADAVAYYEKNKESFRTQDTVVLQYLETSPALLAGDVIVTDDALRRYYEDNKPAYTAEEERNVNHILVQVREGAPDADQEAAREKIAAVRNRALEGESFEDLAREISDDVGSNTEGGETGFFPRGAMAPEFEAAAFELEEGDISEPVRTRFGYHLIRLKEVRPGGLKPFDEVRKDVEAAYVAEQSQKLFFDQAEQFSNLVYEHPDSLEVAADALGLEIQKTETLTRSDLVARFSERLATAAFEPEVLLEGLNSDPVELDDGRVVAVRVLEHDAPRIPPLSAVRAEVEDAVLTMKLREKTETVGKEMLALLRDGAPVSEVVEARGFGWERVEGARRESTDVNRAVLRAAFRSVIPGEDPVFSGIQIGKSDYAVVRIANPVTPDPSDLGVADVAQVKQELADSRTANTWQEYLKSLRAVSEIKTFPENL